MLRGEMRAIILLLLASAVCGAMPRIGDSEAAMRRELGPDKGRVALPGDRVLYTFDRGTVTCQNGVIIALNLLSDEEVKQQKQAEEARKSAEAAKKAAREQQIREAAEAKAEEERKAAEAAKAAAAKVTEEVDRYNKIARTHLEELVSRRVLGLAPKGFGVSRVSLEEGADKELRLSLDFNNDGAIRVSEVKLSIEMVDANRELVAATQTSVTLPVGGKVSVNVLKEFTIGVQPQKETGPVADAAQRCTKLKSLKDTEGIAIVIMAMTPETAAQTMDVKAKSFWLVKRTTADGPRIVDNRPGSPDKQKPGAGEQGASYGSGMVFTKDGYLFTNNHVVDGAKSCFVVVYENGKETKRLPATVVTKDKKLDLAILKVTGWSPPAGAPATPPPVVATSAAKMGDSIFVLGYPLPGTLSSNVKFTKGDISDLTGADNNANELQHTAPIQPGNSGGPTCLSDGRVIGVVVSSLNAGYAMATTGALPQGVNFSVKSDCLLKMAEKAKVKVEAGKTASDPVGHVKAYTVQLMCTK